ncbi:MAG: NYN domain-containing protein [Caldilineaceae bacterium]
MKTFVYVDGFNFYYGAVKNTHYKWVNLDHLCRLILPKNTIERIKYFTAHVTPRPHDPNQHIRQQTYLRALATIPHLEIILGHFLSHKRRMPLAQPPVSGSPYAEVLYTEEKGSDVNLATHLLVDGFRGRYQVAVVVSNDSDLAEPIRMVRRELGLDVIILNPYTKPSAELKRAATFVRPIRQGPLQASQFPHTMSDANGVFAKPATW